MRTTLRPLAVAVTLAAVTSVVTFSATTANAAQHRPAAAPTKAMNLNRIAAGKYGTLTGKWTEEAYAFNPQDGSGIHWRRGGTDTLTVSRTKIANETQHVVIHGHELTSGSGKYRKSQRLLFHRLGKHLDAQLANPNAAIDWDVQFFPARSDLNKSVHPTNGVKLSGARKTIYIWSSNNSYTEVFSQRVASRRIRTAVASSHPGCPSVATFQRLERRQDPHANGAKVTQRTCVRRWAALSLDKDGNGDSGLFHYTDAHRWKWRDRFNKQVCRHVPRRIHYVCTSS